jgi:hypothetical protein
MNLDIGFRSYRRGFEEVIRRSDLRTLLYTSARLGALSLDEAAAAEAAIASLCGGAGFAMRAATMIGAERVAVVRSTSSGTRGSILHAFLILDATTTHRGDWIVGDVHGARTFGEAARGWVPRGGAIRLEPPTAEVPEGAEAEIVRAVMRRLPWLVGMAREHAPADIHAVADLVRIARIVRRGPAGSISNRLRDLDAVGAPHDPECGDDGPLTFAQPAARGEGFETDDMPTGHDAGIGAARFGP